MCVTFSYNGSGDIKSLAGATAMAGLRNVIIDSPNNDESIHYFISNKNIPILGKIMDITGRVLVEKHITFEQFEIETYNLIEKFPKSVYIIEIQSQNREHILRKKIISN